MQFKVLVMSYNVIHSLGFDYLGDCLPLTIFGCPVKFNTVFHVLSKVI